MSVEPEDKPADQSSPSRGPDFPPETLEKRLAQEGDWPGLFRAFMSCSPAGAFIKDPAGRMIYLSSALERVFHLENRPWFGRTDSEMWGEEIASRYRKNDEAVLSSGQPLIVEEVAPHEDGDHYWTVCKFPFRTVAGELFLGGVAVDQTASRRMEQNLRQRESHLRALLAAIPDLVFILSRDFRFLEAHTGNAADLLLPAQVFVGKTVEEVLPAAVAERIQAALQRALGKREPVSITYELEVNGQQQVFDARIVPFDPDRLVVVCRNVTDSSRITEELQRKERELSDFVENAAIGICWLEENGTIEWANRAILEMLGLRRKQFLGRNFEDLFVERSAFRELFRKTDVELATNDFEVTLKHRDGSEKNVVITCSNSREKGKLVRKRCFVRDVTEQHRTRAALVENESLFRQLTENIREVFWMFPVGPQNGLYLSPAFETIWGRRIESVSNDPARWFATLHPDDRERMRDHRLRLHPSGTFSELQYRIVRPDGSIRWIRDRSFPVRDQLGCTVRVAGVAEDITERVQADEERAHQQSVLSHVSRLSTVGEMMASLAHEITQPLGAISNFTSACLALVDQTPDLAGSPLARHLSDIAMQVERCSDFVRRLRSFTRGSPPARVPCHLNLVANESIGLLEAEFRHKNVQIRTEFSGRNPMVLADRPQLQQVLVNLLKNSADAMDDAGTTERIVLLTTRIDGRNVRVSVSDCGPGFSSHAMQNCFQPFFTTKKEGMGLGLPICRSIIELHGGRIQVDPEMTKGARISFTLPLLVENPS